MTTMLTILSPLGPLRLVARGDALSAVHLPAQPRQDPVGPEGTARKVAEHEAAPVLVRAAAQLAEYFAGDRRSFDFPLDVDGTAFQRLVWRALSEIPFGETRSYGALAMAIGRPSASRAVGAANGKNPLAIVVPCHRVIGASGALTGYAGGMRAKQWLLEHERGARTTSRAPYAPPPGLLL